MLPAPHRLRLRRDFGVATRRGRRAASSTLVVHLARSDASRSGLPVRVGFVVSRACGPAVTRNRVRRRLRHLVLARLCDLPAGGLVVVRALPSSSTVSSRRLDADLGRCIDRVLLAKGKAA